MPSKKVRAKQKALIPKQEKLFKKVEKEKRQLIKEYVNACSKRKNITIEKILEEVKEIWNEEIHLEVQKDDREAKEKQLLEQGLLSACTQEDLGYSWQQEDSETCNKITTEIDLEKGGIPIDNIDYICLPFK